MILFSLKECVKCDAVKDYLGDMDYLLIELSKTPSEWSTYQKGFVEQYNVREDLKRTAPILVLDNGEKLIGQLRIKQWMKNR